MMKANNSLLKIIFSGALLFFTGSGLEAGMKSKSFPVKLAKAECKTINPEYSSKLNVDLKFDKSDSKYYSHSLEIMLSTEDYQKDKDFYDYIRIDNSKSSIIIAYDPILQIGKITERVYISEMKDEKMSGKWHNITKTNETNSEIIGRSKKSVHDIINLIGKVTLIEDITGYIADFLENSENRNLNEALDNLSEEYIVEKIPYYSQPLEGNITAWIFKINLKKSGKGDIAVIPVVYLKKGSLIQYTEIEGKFKGALMYVPQDEIKKKETFEELIKKNPSIKKQYDFPRQQIANEQTDQRRIEMAILYYHSIKEGSYPKSLDELVPYFFDSLPMGNWGYDPKTGKIQKK